MSFKSVIRRGIVLCFSGLKQSRTYYNTNFDSQNSAKAFRNSLLSASHPIQFRPSFAILLCYDFNENKNIIHLINSCRVIIARVYLLQHLPHIQYIQRQQNRVHFTFLVARIVLVIFPIIVLGYLITFLQITLSM